MRKMNKKSIPAPGSGIVPESGNDFFVYGNGVKPAGGKAVVKNNAKRRKK